ncbi:RidA family protein [Algihabitans albus]|uniref:hypothetical protein n=1 Tax=Algihabitans albus TaxID=2164067 RepID=UPI0035D01E96
MSRRLYVPFDVFAMQEDVSVSTLVRDGSLGWTCGQCPLDREGHVVAPNDLMAQARFVCDMLESVVPRGGFDQAEIGKLNVYFAENAPGDGAAALAVIRDRNPQALVLPIRVPHFYYDGMMIEVDVFAATGAQRRHASSASSAIEVVDADDVTWAFVQARPEKDQTLAEAVTDIEATLRSENLYAHNLISDQWFATRFLAGSADTVPATGGSAFISLAEGMVLCEGQAHGLVAAELAFSRRDVSVGEAGDRSREGRLYVRDDGVQRVVTGIHADPQGDLVSQTSAIMSRISEDLESAGMSFANVVKLTAHYVGGASAEELHGNMKVRHGHYRKPGPASTGLPVASLLDKDCRIAIAVMAVR